MQRFRQVNGKCSSEGHDWVTAEDIEPFLLAHETDRALVRTIGALSFYIALTPSNKSTLPNVVGARLGGQARPLRFLSQLGLI